MLSDDEIFRIRDLYYKERVKICDIRRITGVSYHTIRKYIDMDDFNIPCPAPDSQKKKRPSILDPYKPILDEYIKDDMENGTHKQKHTATRAYERLCEEGGYKGGDRLVREYFKARQKELGSPVKKAFVPLEHDPGEAQGDFAECENFIEDGKRIPGVHFTLSFPYSNGAFIQIKYGQNTECLLESMKAIFEYIGGVPRVIWLDNASTMIATIGKTVDDRKMTESFRAFVAHYGFDVRFANPYSGNEKGSVEVNNKTQRVHSLVPIPRFVDIGEYNKGLLCANSRQMEREHYRKGGLISKLFEDDKKALLPLPSMPFDTCRYEVYKTDPCGLFVLDKNYTYSSSYEVANETIHLKITSRTVTVMNTENEVIVVHRRLYGKKDEKLQSINWIPYLPLIAIRPRSWMNTGLAKLIPKNLEKYIEKIKNPDRGKVIKIISKIAEEHGLDEAIRVVMEALNLDDYDPEGLDKVYRRIYQEEKPEPETPLGGSNYQAQESSTADLSQYDELLGGDCGE